MVEEANQNRCGCVLDPTTFEVDAGAALVMRARISCAQGCNLDQLQLSLRDDAGRDCGQAACTRAGDETFQLVSDDITLPEQPGTYPLSLVATLKAGACCKDTFAAQAQVTVRPHATRLNVWGLPSAVPANEDFSFNIGLKCSSACDLSGQTIQIRDPEGTLVLEQAFGSEIWPGTEALRFLKVTLKAPAKVGLHEWHVVSTPDGTGLAHAAGEASFRINVHQEADCEVLVDVRELATEAPLANATVVLHPFRSTTDANGVARFMVARGDYDLLVSCSKHMPSSTVCTISGHMKTNIVLAPEAPWTPHEEA